MSVLRDPFIDQTLNDLRTANEWCGPQALYRFQQDLALTGGFQVRAAATGVPCRPHAHFYDPPHGCLYWFDAEEPFCVVADSLRLGCPVLALVTAHNVYPVASSEGSPLIERARLLLKGNGQPERCIDPKARPLACLGHPNFAHFAWNEFPGLCYLAATGALFDVQVLYDPLQLAEPFCAARNLICCHIDDIESVRGWQARPIVIPGSVYCTAAVKHDILVSMGLPADHQAGLEPRIYLSIRETGRTLKNQAAILAELVKRLLDAMPDATVILDGFSLPLDFDRPLYDRLRPSFETRIAGARRIIAAFSESLPETQRTRLQDITGVTLKDALKEIAGCHAYVTHAGTLQHKAGWFYPLPGILHGNQASITPGSLRWTASMMEGAIPPQGVDPALIEDHAVQGMPRDNERNRDYSFRDADRTIDSIVDTLVRIVRQSTATAS